MTLNIKSILNAAWKVGLCLIGIAALALGILIFCVWYENSYGRNPNQDYALSKNIAVKCFNDGRVRLWDKRTGSYISPKLKWVSGTPRRDSVTVYCDVDGNRGYVNCNTGKTVIEARTSGYMRAWQFSEGRAFVVLKGEDDISLIDYSGNIIARNVAPYYHCCDYVFVDGYCELEKDGRYGLLAKDGSWALEQRYFNIQTPNTSGYRIASDEEGYWLFDANLKLVFDQPYDRIGFAVGRDEGEGTVIISKNHVKQLVNYDGTVVEPFVIDGTYDLHYKTRYDPDGDHEYEIVPDVVVYRVDGWEGLMNKHTGRIITPAIYTDFDMISKDLIKAELYVCYGVESVVLDKRGRVIRQK